MVESHEYLKFRRSAKENLIDYLKKDDVDDEVIEGLRDKLKEDVLTCKLMEMYAKREKGDPMTDVQKILTSPALTPENRYRLKLNKKIMDSYKGERTQYRRGIFMYDILAGQYKLEEIKKGTVEASYRRNLKAVLRMQGDLNDFLYKKSVSKK